MSNNTGAHNACGMAHFLIFILTRLYAEVLYSMHT